MKIIDCFTFFNELDLLEFRLKLLNDYVDHFVIAESNLTHSGQPKPFYFEENKARFEQWKDKITYLPVKQTTEGLVFSSETSYNPQSAAWKLENEQRNALSEANKIINDKDLVILSDLDEMPDPFLLRSAKRWGSITVGVPPLLRSLFYKKEPLVLSQLFHYYFLNCQNTGQERWWNGSIVSSGQQLKTLTPQGLRDKRNSYKRIPKAGWHFSYLGGLEKIKQKIRSFAHTEFNKEEFLNDENILKAMEEGKDIFNRPGVQYKFYPLAYYPAGLRKVMKQYPALLHLKRKDSFWEKMYYGIKNM